MVAGLPGPPPSPITAFQYREAAPMPQLTQEVLVRAPLKAVLRVVA
jgi:hypothetical protein